MRYNEAEVFSSGTKYTRVLERIAGHPPFSGQHQQRHIFLRIGRFEESGRDKETERHTENSFMVPLVGAVRRPPSSTCGMVQGIAANGGEGKK